jgi:peptidoglycan/LPS O-acetylase OafA/YrhL
MNQHRDFSLDFVRGISVLLIIFYHYNCAIVSTISNDLTLFKYYGYSGTLGVSMFFILSGASLALSTQSNYSLASFYKKRFFAIFPIFWAAYILIVMSNAIIFQSNPFVGRNPLTFLLTILGIDGFLWYKIPNYYLIGEWFLGCIIILYILFPIIKIIFNKNKYLLLFLSFIFCTFLDKFYALDMLLLRFPLFRIFEFIFGMYFVTFLKRNSHRRDYILLLISTLGILLFFWFESYCNLFVSNAILGILFFVFLSISLKLHENYIPKKAISFLSKYSYVAFLLHHVMIEKILIYSRNHFLITNYNFIIFLATLILVYSISFAFYSSLKCLLQNSISI